MFKKLIEESLASGSIIKPLPVGKYKNLWCVFTGTEGAGDTMTAAALGTVKLRVGNDVLQWHDVADIQPIENLLGGNLDLRADATIQGVAESFHFAVKLRQGVPGDEQNVLDVSDNGCVIEWSAGSTFAGLIGAGNLVVYGEENNLGTQSYLLRMRRFEQTFSVGSPTFDFAGSKNIYYAWVENNDNLVRLTFTVDGQIRTDATREALEAFANAVFQVESYTALSFVPFFRVGSSSLNEAVSNSATAVIQIETAATTLTFYMWEIQGTPNRLARSVGSTQAALEAIASKPTDGQIQAVIEARKAA